MVQGISKLKNCGEWLVVCDESEFPPIEVLMELFDSKDESQGLLLYLSIVPFTW